METVEFLVIGAGVSGLGFANAARARRPDARILVVEAAAEPGGWCRTIKQDGFTWDYSGHFFHFRQPEIERWLRERMTGGADAVRTVVKRSFARTTTNHEVDFPFQLSTHQLPAEERDACLRDLERAHAASSTRAAASFKQMLEQRYGAAMCELFLVPYNEKLYACDLDALDRDAMGRFFPHVTIEDVRAHKPYASYNATFTYPVGGAVEYVNALLRDVADTVALNERLVSIDLERRIATTTKRTVAYGQMVTSSPLPRTLAAANVPHDRDTFTWNQVLVFNLGFDTKGRDDAHWIYFADRALSFYRVGFYDNILGSDRMSLYVEIGMPAGAHAHHDFVETMRARVLDDLKRAQIVRDDQRLVSWHHVVMNPAYVHITQRSIEETARARALLTQHGVHSVGRYGGWTYCSIEDNLIETRALATSIVP